MDEAACTVPADTPAGSPLPSYDPAAENADPFETASVTSQATNNSILPTSESINNLSSKVKTKLSGALGQFEKEMSFYLFYPNLESFQ